MSISYKDSGVDIDKADIFVEKISRMVKSTYNQKVVSGVGGFCALYQMDENRFLASSTDGVGTKLKLAIELNKHDTIGIDLVAMCVNDLICSGAKPLFFLDYFASAKLDLVTSEHIIQGIVNGCLQSEMVLIGGETAEMPGLYQAGDYDLAGFSVGEVYRNELVDGHRLSDGDSLIAVASTGFHSNGYSLVRKILDEIAPQTLNSHELIKLKHECLAPTQIYVKPILSLLREFKNAIKGFANITGSGYLNIPRMNEKFDYIIENKMPLPTHMKIICQMSGLSDLDLYKTFNMGTGFVIATSAPDETISFLRSLGLVSQNIGFVRRGHSQVLIKNEQGKYDNL